jgi:hypothetical protein
MIKKFFHILCVLFFGSLLCLLLWFLYALCFAVIYKVDLLSPLTFQRFSKFWNSGQTLSLRDTLMMMLLFTYFPFCLFVFYKLSKYKFINLLIKPFEWWQNRTLRNYKEVSVNIKNLKIEDKKTIEQVVQERLEKEKKKIKQPAKDDIRKNIIEKINQQL